MKSESLLLVVPSLDDVPASERYTKALRRWDHAEEVLCKALGLAHKEVSPFQSVRDLEESAKHEVAKNLLDLFRQIVAKWLEVSKAQSPIFRLGKRIFINPRTGKPLTKKEWKVIKDSITKALGMIFSNEEEKLIKTAIALGKILNSMDGKKGTSRAVIKLTREKIDSELSYPQYQAQVRWAEETAGENIVELTQRSYKRIHDSIVSSIKNRETPKKLEADLYDKFSEINRDWRRIAETEIANNVNNGFLVAELEREREEEEPVFLKGLSSADACTWCRTKVHEQVVVLLEEPPPAGGDQMTVKGRAYTAVWPGKDNVGRARTDWWVSGGIQHPHCILPGQNVSASAVSALMQSFYEGWVIELTTQRGNRIAVTENHPVLTPYGFRLAKFLREGDDVIYCREIEAVFGAVTPDDYQRPTTIDDLFRSVEHFGSGVSRVVECAPEDFYGDGRSIQGEVNVVYPYGFLRNDFEAAILKESCKKSFGAFDSGIELSSKSVGFQGGSGNLRATVLCVSERDEALALFGGSVGHSSEHSLRPITGDDSRFRQSLAKGCSAHSQFSREFLFRFSSFVPFENGLTKFRMDSDSSAFLIADPIAHIKLSRYSGLVYDLTADNYELYTCNGIVVKNCRCSWVRYVPGFEKYFGQLEAALAKQRAKRMKVTEETLL